MWRVWDFLGRNNPGDFLIPPTMNLGSLHPICGKGIHKHHIINSNRLHTGHAHRQNAWKSCLGFEFCTDDEACQVVTTGLISPQISSFPCIQLLTGFVWILPLVNLYNSRQIRLFKCLIKYLIGCQWCRLELIYILQHTIGLPMLSMQGLSRWNSYLSCRDSYSKCWHEGISWWPLANCSAGWSPKRLIIEFRIVISMIVAIVEYRAKIISEILVVDR